jgi:hypothetical protein
MTYLKSLWSRSQKRRVHTPRRANRWRPLQVESLEDRTLLSQTQVIGLDAVTGRTTILPASDDSLNQAIQGMQVAGYAGIGNSLTSAGQPQSASNGTTAATDPTFQQLPASSSQGLNDPSGTPIPLDGPDGGGGLPPPGDTRQYINPSSYPFNTIGKVTFNNGANWCSGSMINSFQFLTAGHCVAPGNGTWYSGWQIALAQDGPTYRPFGLANWTYVRTYSNWFSGADMHWDWALITLDRNVGNFTGWMGREWYSNDSVYNGLTVNDAGYPQDLGNPPGNYMYGTLGGKTDHADTYEVYFYYNVWHGQSGEPDWRYDGTNRYIDYITTYLGCSNNSNCGTRMTQDKFNDLNNWINDDFANRKPTDRADLIEYENWFGGSYSWFGPGTVKPGQNLEPHAVVENMGTAATGAFTTRFYATTNPNNVTGGYVLGDIATSNVGAFNWAYVDKNLAVPSNIPPGKYYVGWYHDIFGQVSEFDKSNNTWVLKNSQLTVLPGVSSSLTATALSSSQIRLNWAGVLGATSYKVQRWNGSTWVTIATPTTTTYTDDNLVANTTYYYQVIASSAVGDGDPTPFKSATTFAVTNFLVAISPTTVTAGNTISITVTARDANNNTAAGYRGTVTFSSNDSQATLPSPYTFTLADHGVHTFTGVMRTAGVRTVTAKDGGITGTGNVTVNPAAASTLVVAGFPSSTVAGTPGNFTVTAKDPYGNIATGYTGTVHFTSSDGQAVLPNDYHFVAADNGVHPFSATLKTAGSQFLKATDTVTGSITGMQSNILVTPAAASTLVVAGFPSLITAGVPGMVTVTAKDPYNNTATGYGGTVHFTSSDGQASLPIDSKLTNGTGSFSATLYTAGTQSITATDTVNSNLTGTRAGITVVAAALDHFNVTTSADGGTTVAGAPIDVTVAAQDAYGNSVTGYAGTVHFSSGDPYGATLPTDYTFQAGDQGVHTFPGGATLYTAGTPDVTATDTVNAAVTGTDFVNVVAAPATQLVIVAPATVTSGQPFDLTVIAEDPYNNIDTNYLGTITFASTDPDPGVVLPMDYTFQPSDQGSHPFLGQTTLITSGLQATWATDTVNTSITGSASVNVVGGPESQGSGRSSAALDAGGMAATSGSPSATASPAVTGPMTPAVGAWEFPGANLDSFFAGPGESGHRSTHLMAKPAGIHPVDVVFASPGGEAAWLTI